MSKFLSLLAATAAAFAAPAAACQWDYAPEPIGGPSADFLVPKMVAAASFVDVALAEGASPVRHPPGQQGFDVSALSFRVLRRIKGDSPELFLLFGSVGEAKPGGSWGMTHWVDKQGRVEPHEGVREAPVVMPIGMTSCDPPALTVAPGRTYLVFREADGRLLGAVPFHPGSIPRRLTAIALADPWPEDDIARIAVQNQPAPVTAGPVAETVPGRATVRFRRPLSGAAASAVLSRAGAIPFGVLLTSGGVTADYRLGSDLAYSGLIADAVAWATARQTSQAQALAAAFVDRYPLSSLANDYAPKQLATAIVDIADRPGTGDVLVDAADVVATPASQARLAALPEVGGVEPGRKVRGRIVSALFEHPSPRQAEPSAEQLYGRLAQISGRSLAPNALDGAWRLVGSYEARFSQPPLVLTLASGEATATLTCLPPVEGRFTLSGLLLSLDLPKPSLKSCPQTMDYWSAEYLFGTQTFSVRLDGEELVLKGPNGIDLRFQR
ncbi:MAG TPA: hypothetical protein VGD23_09850 [Sphingomicrobium sp.]